MNIRFFEKERIIINHDAKGAKRLFIVLNGTIRTENGVELAKKGQCLGSKYLKREFKNSCYDTNIYVDDFTELGIVMFKDLREFLIGDIEDIIEYNKNSHEKLIDKDNTEMQKYA